MTAESGVFYTAPCPACGGPAVWQDTAGGLRERWPEVSRDVDCGNDNPPAAAPLALSVPSYLVWWLKLGLGRAT